MMRLKAGLLVLSGAMLGTGPAEDPIDLEQAAVYFDEARTICETDGGELWGMDLYGPMLFVDRATRFIVANQVDRQGHLTPMEHGELFVGTLPQTEGIANTKARWAGVEWTMLIWPLPRDEGARKQLLAHEMYHRIQDDLKLGLGIPDNRHLDSRDGRVWMRLEWRALGRALESDGDDRRQAIEDALVFRAHRHGLFPQRVDDETSLELNEGLAEYTGIRAGRDSPEEWIQQAALGLQRFDRHPNFVRSFAYASGPAFGLLLDRVEPAWRTRLNATSDLGQLLRKAFRLRLPSELESEAMARLERYDGQDVLDEEDERQESFLAQQEEFKARFTDGPTLILPLTSFPNYTFNPNGVKAYGKTGSVYLTTRVVTDWGILTVSSGGALFVQRGDDFLRIVVPAPSKEDAVSSPVVGDGYSLELNPGWSLRRIGSTGNYIARRK